MGEHGVNNGCPLFIKKERKKTHTRYSSTSRHPRSPGSLFEYRLLLERSAAAHRARDDRCCAHFHSRAAATISTPPILPAATSTTISTATSAGPEQGRHSDSPAAGADRLGAGRNGSARCDGISGHRRARDATRVAITAGSNNVFSRQPRLAHGRLLSGDLLPPLSGSRRERPRPLPSALPRKLPGTVPR